MEDFSTAVDVALLIARVGLGLTIFAHGYAKFFKGGKIEGTAGWFSSIGMRPGKMHAYFAALGEMGSGLFLALGFFTSVAALGIVGLMAVAGWVVHRHNGFFIISEGWEYTFVIALFAVIIAMIGPGDISIDCRHRLRQKPRRLDRPHSGRRRRHIGCRAAAERLLPPE